MASDYETFFELQRYAVVGHSGKSPFPKLSYRGLKRKGKLVFAVDPDTQSVDSDRSYQSLDALPSPVEAVIIEVPQDEVLGWLQQAKAAGIQDVWLHTGRDTPDALDFAREHSMRLRYGTCAVQYLDGGFPHRVHKLIRKILGRY